MDYSFCLFALKVQRFLTLYRAVPKLAPKTPGKTKGLQELLLQQMWLVSQETEKGIKVSPQEADPEETPQRQHGTGTPSPAAQVLPRASVGRVGSRSRSSHGVCRGRGWARAIPAHPRKCHLWVAALRSQGLGPGTGYALS